MASVHARHKEYAGENAISLWAWRGRRTARLRASPATFGCKLNRREPVAVPEAGTDQLYTPL